MQKKAENDAGLPLDIFSHPRLSEFGKLVYPVISRRSGGLSLGINLNPDRKCNFRCVYCQVDRTLPVPTIRFSTSQVEKELKEWLRELSQSDWRYQGYPLRDIAIAGDGEPTCVEELPAILKLLANVKRQYATASCKLVLFTNGSEIDRADLQEPLHLFFRQGGEIWCKLDSWSQESLLAINRTRLSRERLIGNLIALGKRHPLVIQTCLFRWNGEECSTEKYRPYADQLRYLLSQGAQIKLLQLYTLARAPESRRAHPWPNEVMDRLAAFIGSRADVAIEVFYGQGEPD